MSSAESRSEIGWIVPTWDFSDRLRKARSVAGLDQKDFAKAIGTTAGSLAGWESGRSKPRDPVVIAKRIEMLTRIPATWILGLHEEHPHLGVAGGEGELSPPSGSNRRPSLYKVVDWSDEPKVVGWLAEPADESQPCDVVELRQRWG